MLLTGALCAVQSNKEFTVFVKWLPALAVLGVLYAYPAHAAEPLEDASEALENPVSYTHLEVYKRQDHWGEAGRQGPPRS